MPSSSAAPARPGESESTASIADGPPGATGRGHVLTLATAAGLVLAIIGLTGCGTGRRTASPDSAPASASSRAGAVTQNTLPPASEIVNDLDKRKSVALTKCAASDGGWAASGTVKNAGAAELTYDITVFFTTSKATVQDYAVTRVTVPAGDSKNWSATKKFAASTPTNCVLRGVG